MKANGTVGELSAIELDQVAGGQLGWFRPTSPAGTLSVQFVSNGPTANDAGWLYKTSFGSVFVSNAPDENFEAA